MSKYNLTKDQLIDHLITFGSNQHLIIKSIGSINNRLKKIEEEFEIWYNVDKLLPDPNDYPVLIKTGNDNYMVQKKEITEWNINKYNITHWKKIK